MDSLTAVRQGRQECRQPTHVYTSFSVCLTAVRQRRQECHQPTYLPLTSPIPCLFRLFRCCFPSLKMRAKIVFLFLLLTFFALSTDGKHTWLMYMNYYLRDGGVPALGGLGGHDYDLEVVIVELNKSTVSRHVFRSGIRMYAVRATG